MQAADFKGGLRVLQKLIIILTSLVTASVSKKKLVP
jgi:hypothetical protein